VTITMYEFQQNLQTVFYYYKRSGYYGFKRPSPDCPSQL